MRRSTRLAITAAAAAVAAIVATPATASPRAASGVLSATGSTIHVAHDATFNTRTSTNWFGYVQGTLEKPGRPRFTSIDGTWTVPTATPHKANESEASSTWIGIGGGCVNKSCAITDETLIQAGTEQNVDASGTASYYAWYELIPAPSLQTTLVVHAGDKIRCNLTQTKPGLWVIRLWNLTTGGNWHITVPYSSAHLSAEWVNETPLTTGGFAALPNLTPTHFDNTLVNGANPQLTAAERIFLTNGTGAIYGTPSVPQSDRNGFGVCSWATSCAVPGGF